MNYAVNRGEIDGELLNSNLSKTPSLLVTRHLLEFQLMFHNDTSYVTK